MTSKHDPKPSHDPPAQDDTLTTKRRNSLNKRRNSKSKYTRTPSNINLQDWLQQRKINSDLIPKIVEELGVEQIEDFEDLDNEDIDDFCEDHNMNKIQRIRLIKAFKEIKYPNEATVASPRSPRGSNISNKSRTRTLSTEDPLSSPRSSRSSTLSTEDPLSSPRLTRSSRLSSGGQSIGRRSSGLENVSFSRRSSTSFGERKSNALDDGSTYFVKNYRIFKHRKLSEGIHGHCDVVLAEVNDESATPIVAKISKCDRSAMTLAQECRTIRHLKDTMGNQSEDLVVKLLDWVDDDSFGNHAMFLERGELKGDLSQVFKNGYLHQESEVYRISIAQNLLQICACFTHCGVVWGDVKPGNFVSFRKNMSFRFKAIDFDSARRDGGIGASFRGPSFLSDVFESNSENGVMFTPGYICPERAKAIVQQQNIKADNKQDVFVLGLGKYNIIYV